MYLLREKRVLMGCFDSKQWYWHNSHLRQYFANVSYQKDLLLGRNSSWNGRNAKLKASMLVKTGLHVNLKVAIGRHESVIGNVRNWGHFGRGQVLGSLGLLCNQLRTFWTSSELRCILPGSLLGQALCSKYFLLETATTQQPWPLT